MNMQNRKQQYEQHREYIEKEGLDKLINFTDNIEYEESIFDAVRGKLDIAIPPEPNDLVRLHKLIRQRKCFTVLEFGVGYSTIIIADALYRNMQDWEKLENAPEIRNRYMFRIFSVDTSAEWICDVKNRLPKELAKQVYFTQSDVEIGTFNGQLCHYYTQLPNIVADFIYLDGPNPKDVKGNICGISFECDERTVMAGDLLTLESTFLPGTFILVDGRTNNARFLERNFQRNYDVQWDQEGDVTTFELTEARLGKLNILGSDFC